MFFEGTRYRKVATIVYTEADGSTRTITAAREPVAAGGAMSYQVREGDRLDALAQRFYRDPRKWWLIADANPQLLWLDELTQPGQVIVIPRDRAIDGGV